MYAQAMAESGLNLHNRWGRTTGSRGGTHTHAVFLVSALRSYPYPCPAATAAMELWELLVHEVLGARTGGGAVSRIGGCRAYATLAGCFPHLEAIKLHEYRSTGVEW